MKTNIHASPNPKAKDNVLYWDDNGRVTCGFCAGATLRMTLRTLSGHRAHPVKADEHAAAAKMGWTIQCETCGKTPCAR